MHLIQIDCCMYVLHVLIRPSLRMFFRALEIPFTIMYDMDAVVVNLVYRWLCRFTSLHCMIKVRRLYIIITLKTH